MTTLYRGALVFAMYASLHGACAAQSVRGRLIDEGSGAPVSGGFVRLLDPDGRRVSATLSNAAGGYQIRAPARGTYMLHVERLGYASYQTGLVTLDTGVVIRDIVLPQTAIELPSIIATADSRCDARNPNVAAAAVVWDEVQKALSITSWTSHNASVDYRIETARRTIEPGMRRISGSTVDTTTGSMGGNPFKSGEGDSLLTQGFIQPGEAGQMVYYGPDAELFMSDAFQQSHCFRAVVDRKQPDLVGVAFQSNGTIRPYDIHGTLWINKRSYELSRLDFFFDNVPVRLARGTAGGQITFARLATGMWIINSWTLTAPIAGAVQRFSGGGLTRGLRGYLQVSQRVLQAFANGSLVYGGGVSRE